MDLYARVFGLIDARSFSSLWYWIALAVCWSMASHWILGVPWDLIRRAHLRGGQAAEDAEAMLRINVGRLLHVADEGGPWILAALCAAFTALLLLGFWYGVEFAQALFLLAFPFAIVGALSLRMARRIAGGLGRDGTLYRVLRRQRLTVQAIGIAAIFVTSLFGMYRNLAALAVF